MEVGGCLYDAEDGSQLMWEVSHVSGSTWSGMGVGHGRGDKRLCVRPERLREENQKIDR